MASASLGDGTNMGCVVMTQKQMFMSQSQSKLLVMQSRSYLDVGQDTPWPFVKLHIRLSTPEIIPSWTWMDVFGLCSSEALQEDCP